MLTFLPVLLKQRILSIIDLDFTPTNWMKTVIFPIIKIHF